jgi:hypothetical protein
MEKNLPCLAIKTMSATPEQTRSANPEHAGKVPGGVSRRFSDRSSVFAQTTSLAFDNLPLLTSKNPEDD